MYSTPSFVRYAVVVSNRFSKETKIKEVKAKKICGFISDLNLSPSLNMHTHDTVCRRSKILLGAESVFNNYQIIAYLITTGY